MAVATPVFRPKQSARLAATLYSPPETWTSKERALRKGMMPGSRRWTRAPRERKSRLAAGGTVSVMGVNIRMEGGQSSEELRAEEPGRSRVRLRPGVEGACLGVREADKKECLPHRWAARQTILRTTRCE